jgi:hypothetical protein
MSKIGFIGLGIMGKPMSRNLLKAEHQLVIYDIDRAPVDELKQAGAEVGASPMDVAAKAHVIITMLPNSPQVKAVVLGKDGVIEGATKGSIVVDMSSIAPLVRRVCKVVGWHRAGLKLYWTWLSRHRKRAGKKMREQGTARANLSHDCLKQDLGSATDSWRAQNAWF